MKSNLLLFLAIILAKICVYGQDFDVYPKLPDSQINAPQIYENMTIDEFQLLSRNIRMMDMGYALFLPGYIHYKAKENITGAILTTTSFIGLAGFTYNYFNTDQAINLKQVFDDKSEIALASLTLIVATYIYDWIHGKYYLEKKQELIRYKYGIKNQFEAERNLISLNQTTLFSISFNF